MALNRSEIMTAVWTETRKMMVEWSYAASQLREVFAHCLRRAWTSAKATARTAGPLGRPDRR